MSTGTKDFIDDAVMCMKRGDHAFVLLVLDPVDGVPTSTKYVIRNGLHGLKDAEHLEEIVRDEVLPMLTERRQQEERGT